MAFITITKPSVGNPTKRDLASDIIDNLNDLNSRIGSGGSSGISNPSFENFTTNDPDGWDVTETGGTQTIEDDDNTEQAHGAAAIKFTYPASASGGGYFETSDFYECAANEYLKIAWKMLGTSATGAKHIVRFYWHKHDQSASSTASTDAYSDTFNPTAWTQGYTEARVPSDAKYFKIRIIASDTSATPSGTGSISFDDIRFVKGPWEVFRNSYEYRGDDGGQTANTLKYKNVTQQLIWVEAIGGGASSSIGGNQGGGGGGEYAAAYFAAAASTNYAVSPAPAEQTTLTAGHNSTFNSTTVVANGGSAPVSINGGAGGTGGTGQITIDGQDGGDNSDGAWGGSGARGGGGGIGGSGATGEVNGSYPGGGGGGDTKDGDGAPGMVKIWHNDG